MRTSKAAIAALMILVPAGLSAQQPATGPVINAGVLELTIGGRVHTQFNTTSVDTEPTSQLFIRRARIELEAVLNEWVTGVVVPDFGNDDVELKDAYVKLTFAPAFEVLAGQAHRPFGRLEQTSSKRILPIERGLRIRGVDAFDEYAVTSGLDYSDRDVGVQLLGAPEDAPLGLTYALGVFRGPLHLEVGTEDSYQYAARVTVVPLEDLSFGAGWSSRHFVDEVTGFDLQRGHAFEVDAEYGSFAPGLHVLGEVALGDVDPFDDERFVGGQLWLGWRSDLLDPRGLMVEPLLRVSHADIDADGAVVTAPGGTLITPGINVYFGPLNRLMLNYDVWRGGNDSGDEASFRAQLQFGF